VGIDTKKILIGAASLAMLGSIAMAGPAAADGNGQRTIKAEGFRVQTDIGSCNNEWATVSFRAPDMVCVKPAALTV
jgi:hypothetical protein